MSSKLYSKDYLYLSLYLHSYLCIMSAQHPCLHLCPLSLTDKRADGEITCHVFSFFCLPMVALSRVLRVWCWWGPQSRDDHACTGKTWHWGNLSTPPAHFPSSSSRPLLLCALSPCLASPLLKGRAVRCWSSVFRDSQCSCFPLLLCEDTQSSLGRVVFSFTPKVLLPKSNKCL